MTNNQIKRINHVAPFFSLIMPVYNGQKFLQQALESVLRQTFSRF
jgi:glycosyltransferase involved in cell wall biosynthesis